MKTPTHALATAVALMLTAAVASQTTCRVMQPVRTSADLRTSLPGRLMADQSLLLRARVTGYVKEVAVDYGSRVANGTLLARIDAPELTAKLATANAALSEAKAEVTNAEAQRQLARSKVAEAEGAIVVCTAEQKLAEVIFQRTSHLVGKGGATEQALDEAEAQVTMANARGVVTRAMLETARASVAAADAMLGSAKARVSSRKAEVDAAMTMVAFAELKSPFASAVVTMRHLDPGALVKKDETVLLELSSVGTLRAEFYVPERDAALIKVGTKVNLKIDALSKEVIPATISRTTGALSKSNKMIAQVDIDNSEGKLLPGMFVYASILLESTDGVLTLPASALHTDSPGKHFVLIAADGVVKKMPLELASDDGITVQIESGLQGDEQVIIAGLVKPGDSVRIEEAKK
ncbi:MAG: HlyD family secretion protein [Planctomycetota bacterium]|jgi:HlyD family secretion protein